jgi:hypothetical protein
LISTFYLQYLITYIFISHNLILHFSIVLDIDLKSSSRPSVYLPTTPSAQPTAVPSASTQPSIPFDSSVFRKSDASSNDSKEPKKLSAGEISAAVILSVFGAALLGGVAYMYFIAYAMRRAFAC